MLVSAQEARSTKSVRKSNRVLRMEDNLAPTSVLLRYQKRGRCRGNRRLPMPPDNTPERVSHRFSTAGFRSKSLQRKLQRNLQRPGYNRAAGVRKLFNAVQRRRLKRP